MLKCLHLPTIEHIYITFNFGTLLVYLFHTQNAYEALQGQQDFHLSYPPAFLSSPPSPLFLCFANLHYCIG